GLGAAYWTLVQLRARVRRVMIGTGGRTSSTMFILPPNTLSAGKNAATPHAGGRSVKTLLGRSSSTSLRRPRADLLPSALEPRRDFLLRLVEQRLGRLVRPTAHLI